MIKLLKRIWHDVLMALPYMGLCLIVGFLLRGWLFGGPSIFEHTMTYKATRTITVEREDGVVDQMIWTIETETWPADWPNVME